MRPKFRIWDKHEGKWFAPIYKAYKGHVEALLITPSGDFIMQTLNHQYENVLSHESMFPDRFEPVWYTGLQDKNGKEIYVGDIFKAPRDVAPGGFETRLETRTSVVAWHETQGYQWDYWSLDEIEVIGNIYEHPHLVGEQHAASSSDAQAEGDHSGSQPQPE